ncbi:hypothetical protein ACVWZ6_009168 [Bradyrhizobium sp. GM6.1]
MAPIAPKEDFCPASLFMQSASRTLAATLDFMLDGLERTLAAKPETVRRLENTITINVRYQDDSDAFKLSIHISVENSALGRQILQASVSEKLRLKPYHVVENTLTQARLVLLLDGLVVGQLYCSDGGKSLKLEIKERPDARDMGNAVLALDRLSFHVHTPLGSAPADIH